MTTPSEPRAPFAGNVTTPSRPAPADQQPWNPQLGSAMPHHRYRPFHELVEDVSLPDRTWPDTRITRAPLWSAVDIDTWLARRPGQGSRTSERARRRAATRGQ